MAQSFSLLDLASMVVAIASLMIAWVAHRESRAVQREALRVAATADFARWARHCLMIISAAERISIDDARSVDATAQRLSELMDEGRMFFRPRDVKSKSGKPKQYALGRELLSLREALRAYSQSKITSDQFQPKARRLKHCWARAINQHLDADYATSFSGGDVSHNQLRDVKVTEKYGDWYEENYNRNSKEDRAEQRSFLGLFNRT